MRSSSTSLPARRPKTLGRLLRKSGKLGGLGESRFDKPTDPNHADPEGYQLERQILQEEYRERLEAGSQKLLEASNESEIRGHVERLSDELNRLRTARESRRQRGKKLWSPRP